LQGTFAGSDAARRLAAGADAAALSGRFSVAEAVALSQLAAAHLRAPRLPPWSGAGTVLHVVYASSSSVYGETDGGAAAEGGSCADSAHVCVRRVASARRQLLASSYSAMFHLPATAWRFFTVYGPHGRPDMAMWKFTDAVLGGRAIALTATSAFKRDFTHVSDIVDGVACVMRRPPRVVTGSSSRSRSRPHALYNIGRANPVTVDDLISLIEGAAGSKALVQRQDALSVDVTSTFA